LAASIYNVALANAIPDIVTALTAKGLITNILYQSATYLVFTTPLTSKVIKIYAATGTTSVVIYYGDAWTSGSTITNQVTFFSCSSGITLVSIIADTTWFFIACESSTSYMGYGYVGALSNGDVVVFGFAGSSSNSNNIGFDITTGIQIRPITFNRTIKDATGHLYSFPLYWVKITDNSIILDGTNPASTVGVKVAGYVYNSATIDKGPGYYLTHSPLFDSGSSTTAVVSSAFLVEYTP
jgi:hypothetical protein